MRGSRLRLSGVILAGGESRRMGQDKAFLEVGGRRLIDRVIQVVSAVAAEIIIVTNHPELYRAFDARLTQDVYPGKGSLGGIYTGLQVATYVHSLVVACDMPFLNVALLRYMAGLTEGHDAVIPYLGEGPLHQQTGATAKAGDLHPLHAVYSKCCLMPIEQAIARDDLRMIAFLPDVVVRYVGRDEIERFDPAHRSLFNTNTPEELEQARHLARTDRYVGTNA